MYQFECKCHPSDYPFTYAIFSKKKKKTFLTPYTDRLVSVSWGKKYCFFSENFADMLLNG